MIRLIIIPLMDKALEEPGNILRLHQCCNKEDYVYHHAISIGLIGGYIAYKMKCHRADVYQVAIGGCLVDCGISIGSMVKLSNGFIAEIIFIDAGSQTRPVIKVMGSRQIINLGINREFYIEEII
ncbi:hypothetical protein [Peribacillus sp. FSL E2-0159]|uniref:hypothetical protein n=1 Tax=Peribacillus sp. FSL E2-0159 TaxID=2975289 RepID=UPI003159B22D